jgi:hypothetical protein
MSGIKNVFIFAIAGATANVLVALLILQRGSRLLKETDA